MEASHQRVPAWLSIGYLIGLVLACGLVAWLGAVVTEPGLEWYRGLSGPPGTPPDGVFGPIWTILYTFIALSGWLVARRPTGDRGFVLWLFLLQLVFNLLWSVFIFGLQSPAGGLVILVLLTGLIVAYVLTGHRISPWASYLFVPYLLWVLYAMYLNAGILILN